MTRTHIIAILAAAILSSSLLLNLSLSSVTGSNENRKSTAIDRQVQTQQKPNTDTDAGTGTKSETEETGRNQPPTTDAGNNQVVEDSERQDQPEQTGKTDTNDEPGTEQTERNQPPTADAGNNQVVKDSDKVTLDGSSSNDPDGDQLSYNWQLVSPRNAQIKLENDDSAKVHFTAPGLDGTNRMVLVFELAVTDGNLQDSDTVQVLVTPRNADVDSSRIRTLTVIDTGEKPSESQFFASDVCGDGTSAYSYLAPGVKWRTFPVTFGFDVANNNYIWRNAVRQAFATYDNLGQPAGTFFQETNYNNAKIKINWKYIDGPFNKLASTTFSYRTDTKAMVSATITFDSGDKYFVSRTERCGMSGSQFDVQNIATHEIGHAIILGHVTDRLQSMYPNSFAGETLKRSLGTGDKLGVTNLY